MASVALSQDFDPSLYQFKLGSLPSSLPGLHSHCSHVINQATDAQEMK